LPHALGASLFAQVFGIDRGSRAGRPAGFSIFETAWVNCAAQTAAAGACLGKGSSGIFWLCGRAAVIADLFFEKNGRARDCEDSKIPSAKKGFLQKYACHLADAELRGNQFIHDGGRAFCFKLSRQKLCTSLASQNFRGQRRRPAPDNSERCVDQH